MDLNAALTTLARNPTATLDVAEVALGLARDERPGLDVEAYLGELTAMAREARTRLHGDLGTRVARLCRFLFHDLGFRGNAKEYYDARNSYLDEVMDRRLGIPITLSVAAMAVGCRAGLTVVGVALPGHFVVKAVQGNEQVLFDPYHGGRRLTPEDCATLVEQAAGVPFEPTPTNLRAAPLGAIVARMLTNLKAVYLREGDFCRAVRVMERLRQLTPDDVTQRRDIGAALLQAGDPGRAIDHLSTYLAETPAADDAADVRRLCDQARGLVARWN
jgi:regulator of sirC expression with transglutaminase-like and TPR domain